MPIRRLGQFSLLLGILVLGIWLLGQPGTLRPDGTARQAALHQALSPAGSGPGQGSGEVTPGQTVVHDPVQPVTVDFSNIEIHTDETDSVYYQWLNGEIDLDREATIIPEADLATRRLLSQQLEPQPQVQQATSGPSPAAPVPGVAFEAISYSSETGGSVPPDPEIAVGPNHIVAVVNIAVAIYDKSGNVQYGPLHAANLFSRSECRSGLYDPNVLYDEEENRWFIAYDQGPGSSSGGYCVLASRSGDPMGQWNEFFFPLNNGSAWLDFPHAGVGDHYIFMGGNMFSGFSFVEGRVFAFRKSDLFDIGGSGVSVIQRGLGGDSTPQPLNLHGQSAGTWPSYGHNHYFLTDPFNGHTYKVVRWNPASDSLTTIGTVNLGTYGMPVSVPQNGGDDLEANDYRPLDFEYRNGYGWTTMTVACNPGGGTVNCLRFAQINLTNATLGPAGSGVYASDDAHRVFPDLAVNHCNDMAIGYTKSSNSMYPGIWVTGRPGNYPGGVLQPEVQLKAGEVTYDSFEYTDDNQHYRWGDYTGMTVDPDGSTFWYLGQYSKNTGLSARWGTYLGSFSFNACDGTRPELTEHVFLSLITYQQSTSLPPRPLQNGGFEQGHTAWTEYSSNGFQLILERQELDVEGLSPHSGDWLSWLGGNDNEISVLAQTASVPATDPTLRFWHVIGSEDACGFDYGGVVVNHDGQRSAVDVFNLCQDTSTDVWVQRQVDLSRYAGEIVEIELRAETDSTQNSNLFIDDVSLGGDLNLYAESEHNAATKTNITRSKPQSGLRQLPGTVQPAPERIWPVTGEAK